MERHSRVLLRLYGSSTRGIVDATYDLIPAVKPQIAMYEQFGIEGLKAQEDS